MENATEINCEETDQRKMTLHNAVKMNEDENFKNEDLIAFDGSPLTNWEKEKLDMTISMITRRQGKMRDERKSAQRKEKGIIDELRNGAGRVLNEIETEVDVAAEQIQRSLDIIIQHWNSVTIEIVLDAIFVVFFLACFKCRTYRMVT
ncbi:hypothetical protein Tcan_02039 [Toxocara canis]|uniref:Uncharacterized protein n=2 Tax=Toxocara canis TaxID=6265 RepID=A0A0B2URK6_TOXCA|nr:hypothetical protein Tcan_17651 [Toxocara canis]KHN71854.1 hypothetical protein Tcan_02039 [Toxocara canis]